MSIFQKMRESHRLKVEQRDSAAKILLSITLQATKGMEDFLAFSNDYIDLRQRDIIMSSHNNLGIPYIVDNKMKKASVYKTLIWGAAKNRHLFLLPYA